MKSSVVRNVILLFVCVVVSSCQKDEVFLNNDGIPYPSGVKVVDLDGFNDCTLEPCDEMRLTRLVLENVRGIVGSDSLISVTLTFDSIILFTVCGDKLTDFEPGDFVLVSGVCKDGCGYLNSLFPIEEQYYLTITRIEKL